MGSISFAMLTRLPALLQQHGLENSELIDLSIGNDGLIYLLLTQKAPERINGMFVPTTAEMAWMALVLAPDWDTGELHDVKRLDFGVQKVNFHFLQPIDGQYLLLGARAMYYQDGHADRNAVIVDQYGAQLDAFCLGDGIEQCLVDGSNCIITSYFDEGIFGNFGWDDPVGKNGLVRWSKQGEKLWEQHESEIYDCYAVNLDQKNRLWYYYYTEFDLVCTDYHAHTRYQPGIAGSSAFLIGRNGQDFLFNGGYRDSHFYTVKLLGARFTKPTICTLLDGFQKPIQPKQVCFRQSRALLLDGQGCLYLADWVGV